MESESKEELCRNCGHLLFKKNLLPQGGWAMASDTPAGLENEGGRLFFLCPSCKSRNIVRPTSGALPTYEITHAEQ